MNSMAPPTPTSNVIVGVDTHKYVHVAVAIDESGQRLAEHRIPVDTVGYQDLERWAKSLGRVASFGVEGTGSYGVGLASYLR
jgi:transposase